MATIKKYNGSTWENTIARKYETKSEIIVPPTTIYSDGTAITAYTLKGNEEHTGTPSPSNPVDVNGVGERTENLSTIFSPNTASSGGMNFEGVGDKLRLYGDTDTYVQCINNNNINLAVGTYTISASSTRNNSACYVQFRSEDGTSTYATILLNSSTTVTFNTAVSGRIRVICQASTYYNTDELISIMINVGSTAKPYEPYGYKIPISSGGVTTNIYLGSTQTVRQIGCIDMSEYNFTYIPQFQIWACTTIPNVKYTSSTAELGNALAEKYINHTASGLYAAVNNFAISTSSVSVNTGSDSISPSGKLYYALATPETAAVNEPLMKIGDYADTLSNATAIPTTEGANSITVDTTVQPSEFTATWTGWHDATVKEWDGSQWG